MRTHQKFDRTGVFGDRGIHQIPVPAVEMEGFVNRVKAARKADRKDKALRSIMRECQMWARKQAPVKPKFYAHQISEQQATVEKFIVAVA
jgi:hypothetical protein